MVAADFTPLKPDRQRLAQCSPPPMAFSSSPLSSSSSFSSFFLSFSSPATATMAAVQLAREASRTLSNASLTPVRAVARGSSSANQRACCWIRTNTLEPVWLPCRGEPTGGPLLNSSATPFAEVALRHRRASPSHGLAEGHPRPSHPLSSSLPLYFSLILSR